MKPFREIRIRPATNGIIVDVGCKPFVYQDNDLPSFLTDLNTYLERLTKHLIAQAAGKIEDDGVIDIDVISSGEPEKRV